MDLSIICVNWNSLEYLRACLQSVYDNTQNILFEVIVVDNASPEGGVQTLRESFPDIRIIEMPTNQGFAAANNIGFQQSTGDYVLLLNPDTEVLGPALDLMVGQIKALPDAGILGCRLLNTDGTVQLTAIQKLPTILNQIVDIEFFQLRWPGCPLWDISPLFETSAGLVQVEVISGACMLLRRSVFAEIGMFSEDYFMYAEDIDLNLKARQAGYVNYYLGTVSVVHHGGKSSARQSVSYWSTTMKYRAMRKLFGKMGGPWYGMLYRTAIGCVAAVRLLLLAIAYPLGNLLFKRESISCAAKKWVVIFRWAVGAADVSP